MLRCVCSRNVSKFGIIWKVSNVGKIWKISIFGKIWKVSKFYKMSIGFHRIEYDLVCTRVEDWELKITNFGWIVEGWGWLRIKDIFQLLQLCLSALLTFIVCHSDDDLAKFHIRLESDVRSKHLSETLPTVLTPDLLKPSFKDPRLKVTSGLCQKPISHL